MSSLAPHTFTSSTCAFLASAQPVIPEFLSELYGQERGITPRKQFELLKDGVAVIL